MQTKSKKRDCDELFLPLSDDDDDTNGMDKLDSTPGNETLKIKVHLHDQLSCLKIYASVNSISTLPPPSRLVSPGGGALANFALPKGRAFAIPGATPELLICTWFPIRKYK